MSENTSHGRSLTVGIAPRHTSEAARIAMFFGVLLSAASCTLFQFAPQVTIVTQPSYAAQNVSFSYTVVGTSSNSMQGAIIVERHTPFGFLPTYTQQTYLNVPSGTQSVYVGGFSPTFPWVGGYLTDGTYRLTLQVLGPNGQASPLLTATSQPFTVQTSGPEVITEIDPPLFNTSQSSSGAQVTVLGLGFTPTTALAVSGATLASKTYVNPTTILATINSVTPPAGSQITFTASDTGVSSSLSFPIIVVGSLSISSILPSSASKSQSDALLLISGSGFVPFTRVAATDSAGKSIPVTINYQQLNFTSMAVYLDLTKAALGTATITLSYLDGTSTAPVETTFTVTP